MGECFTCLDAASERFSMVLDAETVLDDVIMCEACRTSFDAVSWIAIHDSPAFAQESTASGISEATE